jgi:heme A synthase
MEEIKKTNNTWWTVTLFVGLVVTAILGAWVGMAYGVQSVSNEMEKNDLIFCKKSWAEQYINNTQQVKWFDFQIKQQ